MTADHPRITTNPSVKVGKPVIRDTRIPVELILRLLGQGHTVVELAAGYKVEPEDILACQSYAADVVAERNRVAAE
jgi:uncharacterized protein (DUF433 family)